ncbi:MAG: hypothetical protein H6725_19110 [Sandaracinaceae bacterium]|nr:hypothetical protein [Sandaracinaceae bacterium]
MRRAGQAAAVRALTLVILTGALPGRVGAQELPNTGTVDQLSRTTAVGAPEPAALPSYPSHYGARPLTLPQLTARAATELHVLYFDFSRFNPLVSIEVSAGIGVTDNLELGLGTPALAPIVAAARVFGPHLGLGGWLTPELSRGMLPPTLYARYRVLATESIELGVELDGILPANGSRGGLALGVPMRARVNTSFVVDAAFGVLFAFYDSGFGGRSTDVIVSFSVMPRYAHDAFYVGIDTGLFFIAKNANEVFVPVLLELGATLPAGASTLDVYARGGFPLLFTSASGDAAYPETWELSVGLRGYFDLRAPTAY